MMALNSYFMDRVCNHALNSRTVIWPNDFDFYAKLCAYSMDDTSEPRVIEVRRVSLSAPHSQEAALRTLSQFGLECVNPADLALVVAAYACKNQGADLLKGRFVWLGIPEKVMTNYTNAKSNGVVISHFSGVRSFDVYGTPALYDEAQ